jgi:hypothetical protein
VNGSRLVAGNIPHRAECGSGNGERYTGLRDGIGLSPAILSLCRNSATDAGWPLLQSCVVPDANISFHHAHASRVAAICLARTFNMAKGGQLLGHTPPLWTFAATQKPYTGLLESI